MRERGRVASAWFLSVLGHLTIFGLSGIVLAHSLRHHPSPPPPNEPARTSDDAIEIELPKVSGGSLFGDPVQATPEEPVPIARGGGEATPRLDSGHAGRGGTDTAEDPAINLADRDDKVNLSPDLMSRI